MNGSQATPLSSKALDGPRRWRESRQLLLVVSALVVVAATIVAFTGGGMLLAAALAIAGVVGVLIALNVPQRSGTPDKKAARSLMGSAGHASLDRPHSFEAEVDLAFLVQEVVFAAAPFEKRDPDGRRRPIPLGHRRELSNLLARGSGYCFDRSRAIETLLRLHGLKVRHVSLFSTREGDSPLRTLLRREAPSHSLTEVNTQRGWMAVDSNFRFIGVSAEGEVFDMTKLASLPAVEWDKRNREIPPKITRPFTFVYGLYSRHGQFYPPFVPFPNVNWLELTCNFWR